MDLFTSLLIGYALGITFLIGVAVTLQTTGRRGKLARALFISTAVGIITPLVVGYFYASLFPPPIEPPPHPIDPKAPFLAQLITCFTLDVAPMMGRAAGYHVAQIIDPFCYGFMAIIIAFALSFLLPLKSQI